MLSNDVSRCTSHRCLKRAICKRYLQVALDIKTNPHYYLPYSKFPVVDNCPYYIPLTINHQLTTINDHEMVPKNTAGDLPA